MDLIPINFRCQKVIPLVYDDSLSYYEQLCKLTAKMNELIVAIGGDNEISELKEYVDAGDRKTLVQANSYTDNNINNISIALSNLEQKLYAQLTVLTNLIEQTSGNTREWVAIQLQIFRNEIRNIPLPTVLNPLTGRLEPCQKVFESFYDYLRPQAINAIGYDNLGLTALAFDSLAIGAREFDLYSSDYLVKPNLVRSPFSGEFATVESVIFKLAGLHQNGISALAYDALGVTATAFADKQTSAYSFDWTTFN